MSFDTPFCDTAIVLVPKSLLTTIEPRFFISEEALASEAVTVIEVSEAVPVVLSIEKPEPETVAFQSPVDVTVIFAVAPAASPREMAVGSTTSDQVAPPLNETSSNR